MREFKITLAQLQPAFGNVKKNAETMKKAIIDAASQQANFVVFPELFLTGYSVGERLHQLAIRVEESSVLQQIRKWCKEQQIGTVFGFPEDAGGTYYISACYINEEGKIAGVYRKVHLFSDEKNFFKPGDTFQVFATPFGKMGVLICFDVEFPEAARTLAIMGAEFIVIINANMDPYADYHSTYAKSRAMENEVPIIICNRVGKEGELHFCGESMVIDSAGKILVQMGKGEEIKTATICKDSGRKILNYTAQRRPEIYLNK